MVYLYAFGTSAPTYDAATRELAREHTVLHLRDEPPTALIVPETPPEAVILVFVLPDDDRHVWSALRDLGLLDHVDEHGFALIPVGSGEPPEGLAELVQLTRELAPVRAVYVAALAGASLDTLCGADVLDAAWSGVVVLTEGGVAPPQECGGLPLLALEAGGGSVAAMVEWLLR